MAELDYFFCSDSEKCPFYEKWKTNIDNRLGIIKKTKDGYNCIALNVVVYDPVTEGGIPIEYPFKKRLPENGIIECEKIKTLNLLEEILNKK